MATGVDFVCFPYPRTYEGSSDNPKQSFLPANTMVQYTNPKWSDNLVVARVGYSGSVREYVCFIYYYGDIDDIRWEDKYKDDINTCAFTDPTYGRSEPFSALAETFIGQDVYVTIGYQGRDGKRDTGLKVSRVHGAVANTQIYLDGDLGSVEQASVSSKANGTILAYNGENYAMGLPNVSYSVNLPAKKNYTLVSVEGNIGAQNGDVWIFDATEDLSLTCQFASNYTVAFNANGGTGIMSSQSFVSGVEQVLSKNVYTNRNLVFAGWNTAADGSGKTYTDGSDGSGILADIGGNAGAQVTLYAQWRKPIIYITNSNTSGGLLKLYHNSFASSNLVATESGGVLAAEVEDGTYIVYCEQKNTLYYGRGLGAREGYIDYAATIGSDGLCMTMIILAGDAIDLSFYYTKRTTYAIDFAVTPTGAGTAILQKKTNGVWPTSTSAESAADEVVGGVNKWLPQQFRFFVTPSEGYNFTSLHIVDAVDGTSSQPSVTNPPVSPNYYACNLTEMDDDIRVDLVFEKKKFNVGVGIDDASAAYGEVKVAVGGASSETGLSGITYGTEATFTAALKSGVSSTEYAFAGWYINGSLVSTSASYTREIKSAVTVVAKFAARTRLGVVFEDNREDKTTTIAQEATLQVDGETIAGNVYDAFIVLGGRIDFVLTPGSMGDGLGNWSFNAWYDAEDTTYQTPYAYNRVDGFTITESVNRKARLTALKIECKIIAKVHINNPATEVVPDLANPVITSSLAATVESGGYAFTLDGSGLISLTASSAITYDGQAYAFNGWATDVPGSTGYSILSYNITYTRYLTARSLTIYALYGEPMEVEASAGYIGGCNRTMGTLTVGGESNESTGRDSVTAKADQGSRITLSAKAKNGYRFAGWYLSQAATGDAVYSSATIELNVVATQTFYAAFERDTSAIYEWEGADANKMLEWKSKVYVSPRPFNPSALRVDTEGYPVGEIRVGMFSSPDSAETAVSVLTNVASQNARRLPKRRPERYIQVTLKNDHEIDSVVVGTSMGGLAV